VWKAWDANARTLLQQPHRFRMEADRTPASFAETLRTTSSLPQARHPRCPLLRGAHWLCLAPASARSAALAHRLLLLHDLAARRTVAENPRRPARSCSGAEREKKAPTAAIIDSQSVKTSNHGGVRGYDAGKKVMGRKRHLLVDTLGLILHVVVHPASIQDRDGAKLVLGVLLKRFGWLRCIFADSGYAGELVSWCKRLLPHRGVRLEIVKRSDADQHRFVILRKRWIVERTFGWLSKSRRLSKDYEYRTDNSEAMILIAATRLMLARLA
jgi:transposase